MAIDPKIEVKINVPHNALSAAQAAVGLFQLRASQYRIDSPLRQPRSWPSVQYRALFFGGPLHGTIRDLNPDHLGNPPEEIVVAAEPAKPTLQYDRYDDCYYSNYYYDPYPRHSYRQVRRFAFRGLFGDVMHAVLYELS